MQIYLSTPQRVSVVGFTCQVGPRIIRGIVKEKSKTREEYDVAVARGDTASLLEQGPTSDVFMTSLGNIPAGEKLFITIHTSVSSSKTLAQMEYALQFPQKSVPGKSDFLRDLFLVRTATHFLNVV